MYMKKKIYKKIYYKIYQKLDLLENLKKSLLYFNFFMTYIIHKMLAFLKNHLSYLKDSILESFLRSIIDFYFF